MAATRKSLAEMAKQVAAAKAAKEKKAKEAVGKRPDSPPPAGKDGPKKKP